MNDRFKFNAVVTGWYDIDTPEEYQEFRPKFFLKNISIANNGDIGIYIDYLEAAIKESLPDISNDSVLQILDFFWDNSFCGGDNWVTITPDVILQCTGLKDKNGTLIYEGDIVEVQYIGAQISLFQNTYEQEPQPERFAIIYDYNWHKFTCKNKYYRNTCEIHSLDIEKIIINPENKRYEVIGNIYENPELLKSEE